jgi:LPS-assembly lipoprotein
MNARRLFLAALAASAMLAAAGCGFQLRGSRSVADLPFETVFITLPTTSDLHAQLKRGIEATGKTRVVGDAKSAQVTLAIIGDSQAKNVLSLDTSGHVREFQLVRTLTLRLHDIAGRDWLPATQIVGRRDMYFSDQQILAKEAEEAMLWRDMQNDLSYQIMRRLATAKPPGETAAPRND